MTLCRKFDHKNCWPKLPEPPLGTVLENPMVNELEQKLEVFNAWFKSSLPSPAKIAAAYSPGFRIGTVAIDDIESESTYLGVPTSIILDSESAFQSSSTGDLIKKLSAKYDTRDDFHELLLFLIHETFVSGTTSPYWPYLHLLPRLEEMENPILWSNATLQQRLGPSHLLSEVLLTEFYLFLSIKRIYGRWCVIETACFVASMPLRISTSSPVTSRRVSSPGTHTYGHQWCWTVVLSGGAARDTWCPCWTSSTALSWPIRRESTPPVSTPLVDTPKLKPVSEFLMLCFFMTTFSHMVSFI